jgi:sterol desaturase/sphingolipid hydroxylase (fatty acid hydroxylase superfamily)
MSMSFEQYIALCMRGLWSMFELGVAALCVGLWMYRKRPSDFVARINIRSGWFNLTVGVLDTLLLSIPLSFLAFKFISFIQLHMGRGTLLPLEMNTWLPSIAVGALAIFIGDFVAYWRHRLEHAGWFWQAHVMHHSDAAMNWSTIYRFHPVNRLTTALIDMTVLVLLGFPAWAVVLNGAVRHYYGAFVHIDQPWTLGPLGKLLVSPAMHRWHHVLEGEGVGKNFASVFSVFDRWFGTHYCPGPCDLALGVPGVRDTDLLSQYLLPFRFTGGARDAPVTSAVAITK